MRPPSQFESTDETLCQFESTYETSCQLESTDETPQSVCVEGWDPMLVGFAIKDPLSVGVDRWDSMLVGIYQYSVDEG